MDKEELESKLLDLRNNIISLQKEERKLKTLYVKENRQLNNGDICDLYAVDLHTSKLHFMQRAIVGPAKFHSRVRGYKLYETTTGVLDANIDYDMYGIDENSKRDRILYFTGSVVKRITDNKIFTRDVYVLRDFPNLSNILEEIDYVENITHKYFTKWKNCKIALKGYSTQIQQQLFKAGFSWRGRKTLQDTRKYPFLFLNNDGYINYGSEQTFKEDFQNMKVLTIEEVLAVNLSRRNKFTLTK